MEFPILGSLEVWRTGYQVPLRGSEQRGLLASLLLHVNEVVSRDRLGGALLNLNQQMIARVRQCRLACAGIARSGATTPSRGTARRRA